MGCLNTGTQVHGVTADRGGQRVRQPTGLLMNVQ